MTLDLNNDTVSFKINDIDYGKAFDVEHTSYKVAVSLNGKTKPLKLKKIAQLPYFDQIAIAAVLSGTAHQ